MSASGRLKVLGNGLSREVIEDQIRREGWNPDYATPQKLEDVSRALRLAAYDSALPELIAVVKAAENAEDYMVAVRKNELETFLQVPLSQWLPVVTAVAALDEALSTKGEL